MDNTNELISLIIRELESRLPELQFTISKSGHEKIDYISTNNKWWIAIDPLGIYDKFNFCYDLSNPEFSFDDLACDVILINEFIANDNNGYNNWPWFHDICSMIIIS